MRKTTRRAVSGGIIAALLVVLTLATIPTGAYGAAPMPNGTTATSGTTALTPAAAAPTSAVASIPPSINYAADASATGLAPPALSIHSVPLHLPGVHPAIWGPDGTPPGSPAPFSLGSAGGLTCNAVWPTPGGQALLPPGCAGHDEPTISFYSSLSGSGGNATWNATLPEDASATQNQSDLYAAAWFALIVADPASWLGQCYVEVQLYPDFSWNNPGTTTSAAWSGAAVGWQIDPATGAVDTCLYSPLYTDGSAIQGYFAMSQGDQFIVNLLGWVGDPTGEHVSITDETSGASTYLDLSNASVGPLDPAYRTNSVPGSLLWTSGGQYPISFGFEIGRAGNSAGVANNTYGGCNPGGSGPSPKNPSTPCPSYDPVSWVNDTLTPWGIGIPTFSNGATSTVATQFGVASTVGGAAAFPTLSNGTCGNRIGSAFCTYPWFGYSCAEEQFEFGATDFAIETNDFGQSNQFAGTPVENLLGLPVYEPSNFAVPGCGHALHSVTIEVTGSGTGSVDLLSVDYTSTGSVDLPSGNYSLRALNASGSWFQGWTTSGPTLALGSLTDPSTGLHVTGTGTLTAVFGPTAQPATQVWFNSSAAGAITLVTPSDLFENGTNPITVPAGSSVSLTPGVYGVQAGAPAGWTFSSWSVVTGAISAMLASSGSEVSWLTVTGAGSRASVVMMFTSTEASTNVTITGIGNGTIFLGANSPFPYNSTSGLSQGYLTVTPGTYPLRAHAAPGWVFFGWSFGPSALSVGFNQSTNVSVQPGWASIVATFAANVTTVVGNPNAGATGINGVGPLANSTTSWLPRGTYTLDALPNGYWVFSHWTVSDSAGLWVQSVTASITHITVNSSGTVTANYAHQSAVDLTFELSPVNGGTIRFNFETIATSPTVNSTLTNGTYVVRGVPASGYFFKNWKVTGNTSAISFPSGNLQVHGPGGILTAVFAKDSFAVSFVSGNASVSAVVGGQTVPTGQMIFLLSGKYTLDSQDGTNTTFLEWITTGNIYVGSPLKRSTNLTVYGAGTLAAVADPFVLQGVTGSPPAVDVGVPVTFTAQVAGARPMSYSWAGLPTGCASRNVGTLVCLPTASGVFHVVATVAGANSLPVKSSPLSYSVGKVPSISSFSAAPPVLDLGMSTTFTISASGGTAPLMYTYLNLPAGCTSANQSSLACVPGSAGASTVEAQVSDGVGVLVTSNLTLTVNPALALTSFTASRSQVTVGIAFTLAVAGSGGTSPLRYTYNGLPSSCPTANAPELTCVPSMPGNYTVNVNVTDSAGGWIQKSVAVQVNPLPAIAQFTVTPNPSTNGSNVTMTVVAAGGTGPLTYSFTGLPSGCVSANTSSFTCRPNATGLYTITVTVTDVLGVNVSQSDQLTVQPTAAPSTTPGGTSGLSWWAWLAIGLIVVAAVAIVLFLARRRRSSRNDAPPTEEGSTPPAPWKE